MGMTSRDQLQETLCNRLFWHTAERDDVKVADYLFHRCEMDVVYAMDEATLFDSFFNYLQEIKVFPILQHLDPQKQRRKNIPFIQLVLVFLMKVVGSIKTIDEISDLLLNVKISSIIDSLVIDRGCKVLYEIDRQGIEFVIPLKRNMQAAKDARQLALDSESFPPVTREVEVVHGYGKKRHTERVFTTLVG